MANSVDPDQQLIWIHTVCKGRVYLGSVGLKQYAPPTLCLSLQNAELEKGHNSHEINVFFVVFFFFFKI